MNNIVFNKRNRHTHMEKIKETDGIMKQRAGASRLQKLVRKMILLIKLVPSYPSPLIRLLVVIFKLASTYQTLICTKNKYECTKIIHFSV